MKHSLFVDCRLMRPDGFGFGVLNIVNEAERDIVDEELRFESLLDLKH